MRNKEMVDNMDSVSAGRPTVLLTVVEVAKRLALSKTKVYLLIWNRELPSVHIGTSVRVVESDLEHWISALRANS